MMGWQGIAIEADPEVEGIILPRERMRGRWVLLGLDILSAVALLAMVTWWAEGREQRIALVIGNAAYQGAGALLTPTNDAAAVAKLFRAAGFSAVQLHENVANADLRQLLR